MQPTPTSNREGPTAHTQNTVLEVKDLKTHFFLDEGLLKAVDGVSFSVKRRETLGIIGESGCGKSMTARSILRLVKRPGKIVGGQILLHEKGGQTVDIAQLSEESRALRKIRGSRVAMVFQEPMTSLSPVHTIGNQIVETVLLHRTRDKQEAQDIALATLAKVGMPEPKRTLNAYPFELSGGLRQRAMIAMALAGRPSLLIADEPTTALDVTVQWQILKLMNDLKDEFDMSMIYITHDLGVVAQVADTMAVMYLGQIVEYGRVHDLFKNPLHPYTRKLLASVPTVSTKKREHLEAIRGNVPVPINLPIECRFRARCDDAFGSCSQAIPALQEIEQGHFVRCFLHHDEAQHA